MTLIINKLDLIIILENLVKNLKKSNIQEFKTETDFYKLIGTDEWTNFQDDNIEPDIGSLKDDWETLKLLLTDKDRPLTSVDIDRIASILRIVSEEISPLS